MLFGHQNDDTNQPVQDAPLPPPAPPVAPGVNPLAVDPSTGVSLPSAPAPTLEQPEGTEHSVLDQPAPSDTAGDDSVTHFSPEATNAEPNNPPAAPEADSTTQPSGPLLSLKQQVLTELSPLVNHLDQSPEEKFRTTMMLIQSTDNQALLQDAYDTAQKITDEKVRAQALLDVINEINYFTQQK